MQLEDDIKADMFDTKMGCQVPRQHQVRVVACPYTANDPLLAPLEADAYPLDAAPLLKLDMKGVQEHGGAISKDMEGR